MLQRLFLHMALNRDSGNVAGVLDQLQVVGTGVAWFMIIDRKSAESFPFAGEQWAGPNGTNSIRQQAVTIEVPGRIDQDVGHIHRLPPINRCAAGSSFRTNRHGPHVSAESGKAGRSGTVEFFTVSVGEPNR